MTMDSVQNGAFHRLCREFQQAFIANGAPNEMALFAQTEPSDGARRVYFTPGCSSYVQPLIEGYGGTPCTVPDDTSLTLVFGVPGAESVVFLAGGDGVALDGVAFPERISAMSTEHVPSGANRHVK